MSSYQRDMPKLEDVAQNPGLIDAGLKDRPTTETAAMSKPFVVDEGRNGLGRGPTPLAISRDANYIRRAPGVPDIPRDGTSTGTLAVARYPNERGNPGEGLISGNLPGGRPDPAITPDAAPAPSTVGARERVAPTAVVDPVMKEAERLKARTGLVESNMTVQGQLEGILSKDSALMTQARARAMKEANSRGLINSSMAAQAGEEAMISQALPIAQQDAGTYFTQQRDNLGAENQTQLTEAQLTQQRNLAEYGYGSSRALQAEGSNQRLNEQEQGYQNSNSMFERDNELKERLTRMGIESNERTAGMQMAASGAAAAASAAAQERIAGMELAARERIATTDQNFRREAMNFDATTRRTLTELDIDSRSRANREALGANSYTNYTQQFTAISTSQMEPDDKDRALRNLASLYSGNPYMPVTITVPPPGGATPPPPPPPPPNDNRG